MPFRIGPLELTLILILVAMLFGVGKLPELFGAVGKGIREFRKEVTPDEPLSKTDTVEPLLEPKSEKE